MKDPAVLKTLRVVNQYTAIVNHYAAKVNHYPNLPFLALLDFLAFFLFEESLAILSVFPFFPKDLGVRQA